MSRWLQPLLCMLLVLMTASLAGAQYSQDFEAISAAPGGVVLTGQDFYYVPSGVDFYAYTYAGNVLGLVQNPEGGEKFIAGATPDGINFARAQRDAEWGDGTGLWVMEYDVCGAYLGAPPSANNIGSYSIRYDDATVHNIHLFSWVDPNVPTSYNAFYLAYDAAGVQFAQPGTSPGPAWEGLDLNHWYRFSTTIDLDANLIVEVGVTDLETMVETTVNPVDWFLVGGAAGPIAPPLNFRVFAGGAIGNVCGYDNMIIAQPTNTGACCLATGCVVMTEPDCMAAGGYDFIPGDDCQPDPCFSPVESKSWGQIKNAYR